MRRLALSPRQRRSSRRQRAPAASATRTWRHSRSPCGLSVPTWGRSTASAARTPSEALLAFQERAGLVPDGIAGPMTRRALGDLGAPELGSRSLSIGTRGWDVAELQFKLAWHGFPSGPFDGAFGPRLEAALRRFQRFADLPSDRRRRPADDGGARPSAADEPSRSQRAGRGAGGRRLRAPRWRVPRRCRLRRLSRHPGRVRAGRAGRVGGGARKLRQHRGRPARSRRADALCPPVTDRRRSARPRVDRHGVSASSARPGGRPARISTSRCACAARPSTRSARLGLAEPLVEAVDEVGHALEALRDHAHAVLEEVLGLDAERLRQPREDVVRGDRAGCRA